jgi:hypothetical protein
MASACGPASTGRTVTASHPLPVLNPAGIGRDREDLFFPEPGHGFDRQLAAAKQICAGCPVATDYRAYARGRFER